MKKRMFRPDRIKNLLKSRRRGAKPEMISGDGSKTKRRYHLQKRKIAVVVAAIVLATSIPLVFATAANTNEMAKITEIKLEATATASANATPSPSPTASESAVGDGVLTSDLTETTTQAEATPAPSAVATPASSAEATPAPSAEAAATPAATTEPTYTVLSSGVNDPFVAMIQQRLMDLDYMERDETTTLFGPITTQAIEYFQRKNGLPIDGIAGVETQALLFSENAKYYTVSEGASGPDVESIQQRLEQLGYPVSVTSYFGTDTTKAVSYFQRMNGLADDGNVGAQTKEMLYSKDAEKSLEYGKKASGSGSSSSSGSSESGNSSSSSSGSSSGSDSSSGSSSGGGSSDPAPAANPGSVEAFINAALAQIGKTYVLGGKGPDVFDCSGFVYYSLKASGNGIDYMTSGGWANSGYTRIDSMGDLQRGDVVCERGHVGIYLGDGQIVHASSSNGKILISSNVFNSNYWTSNFICGRRPL